MASASGAGREDNKGGRIPGVRKIEQRQRLKSGAPSVPQSGGMVYPSPRGKEAVGSLGSRDTTEAHGSKAAPKDGDHVHSEWPNRATVTRERKRGSANSQETL